MMTDKGDYVEMTDFTVNDRPLRISKQSTENKPDAMKFSVGGEVFSGIKTLQHSSTCPAKNGAALDNCSCKDTISNVKNLSSRADRLSSVEGVSPRSVSFGVDSLNEQLSEVRQRRRNNSNPSSSTSTSSTDDISTNSKQPYVSLSGYLYSELTRGYWLEHDEARFTEKRQRVYAFMKIPRELEKFMTYGFFQCLDAFLYIFTFLPLRFLMALVKLCIKGCIMSCWSPRGRLLEPAQICDLLKGSILIVCCVIMHYVDFSMMYHLIRGQEIIKLYIFFNMLEVADRLFSSFGQDILDSLFWTATEPRHRRREHVGVIPHLLLAIIYVFMHATLVLFQATTLNVAFNSHSKALLTIMMSNNFVELKGSVFKKFEKNNLFQMSCSDVRERFHLIILLGIVAVRNLTEVSWKVDHLWSLVANMIPVLVAEVLVDWVKHAFITKFNDISHEVYSEYTVSIAYDLANSRQKTAYSDLLDVVSRRMGFIPLPLAVLLIRVVLQSVRVDGLWFYMVAVVFFLCLVTLKVLNSIILLGVSINFIEQNKKEKSDLSPVKVKDLPRSRSFEVVTSAAGHQDADSDSPGSPRLARSQSMTENISEVETTEVETENLASKSLLCNSSVSLLSVGFNEEYIKDVGEAGSSSPVVGKTTDSPRLKKFPSKPLSDVDRYTMCSNRII